MSTSDSSVDGRGCLRGHCLICTCAGYNGESERNFVCVNCPHKAGQHQNMSSAVRLDSASGGAVMRSVQTGRSSGYPSVQSDSKHTSRSDFYFHPPSRHSDWDDEAIEDDVQRDSTSMAPSQQSVPFVSRSIQSTSALGGAHDSRDVFFSRPSSSPPWASQTSRSTHALTSLSTCSMRNHKKSSCARKRAHSSHIPPPSPRAFLPGSSVPSFTTRAPPANRSRFGSSGSYTALHCVNL